MTRTDTQTPATDATRAAELSVVAGVTAKPEPASKPARKRQPSAATRKSAATQKPAAKKAAEPVGAASMRAAEKPAKKDELTATEMQHIVMHALIAAGADLVASWTDRRVPKSTAANMIAARLGYCPDAKNQWDKRLPMPERIK
jgi:hypothetical protein